MNSVKLLYLIINEINGYIEKSKGNKYLSLVSSDKTKDTLNKYEELWNKTRSLIGSITNFLDNSELLVT